MTAPDLTRAAIAWPVFGVLAAAVVVVAAFCLGWIVQ